MLQGIFLILVLVSCSSDDSSTDTGTIEITPRNFSAIIQDSALNQSTQKNSVSDRQRFFIRTEESLYLKANDSVALEFVSSLSTKQQELEALFYAVQEPNTSCFRLDSVLHGLYSLDYSTATQSLVLNNSWGIGRDQNDGYLCSWTIA